MATAKEKDLIDLLCVYVRQNDKVTPQMNTDFMRLSNKGRSVWESCNPLNVAIELNKKELVKYLIQKMGFNVNFTTKKYDQNWCGLLTAIQCKNWDLAKFLVCSLGADLSIKRNHPPNSSILTFCILREDKPAMHFLVKELGADINSVIKYSSGNVPFLPLHYALMRDFNLDRANWPMTNLALELGGNCQFATSLNISNSSISLGKGNFNGSVYQFASLYPKHTFDPARKIGKVHLFILKKLMDKKGDQQLLRKSDENLEEDIISAVMLGDEEFLGSILAENKFKVNDEIKGVVGNGVDAPILFMAVHNEDISMTKILIDNFHANINVPIIWSGKISSILLYSIWLATLRNKFSFVKELIGLKGVDFKTRGWILIKGQFVFASPLEASLSLGWESVQESKDVLDLFLEKVFEEKKELTPRKLYEDIKSNYMTFKSLREVIKVSASTLNEKLQKTEVLYRAIQDCENDRNFLTQRRILEEQKSVEEQIERAKKIQAEIELIQCSPDYIKTSQIKILEKNIISSKQEFIFENSETMFRDLECIICQSFPEEQQGSILIFSCSNHHLLCSACLTKIDNCPLCKENFNIVKPTRNQLAERLVTQFQSKSLHMSEIQKVDKFSAENNIADLGENLHENVKQILLSMSNLEQKLKTAMALQQKEQSLMESKEYLTVEDAERKKRESETKLEKANRLHQKIKEVKENPDFLTKEEIVLIKDELKNILLELK